MRNIIERGCQTPDTLKRGLQLAGGLHRNVFCLGVALLVAGGFIRPGAMRAADGPAMTPEVSASNLLGHIKVLSSDEFEGRAPGTAGEEKTVNYLVGKYKEFGLQPGNPDGTYIQNVPLVGSTAKTKFVLEVPQKFMAQYEFPRDYVMWTKRVVPEAAVTNSDVVFVGYGVVAPEYGWDDYKGVDVRGKTILMLINDPPVPDPNDPTKLDDKMFKGKAMTYYGRWTYKYEIAAAKGAAAAIIVHETGPAGYPFQVIQGSSGRENFDLQAADGNRGRVAVEGWVPLEAARGLCAHAGQDFDKLKAAALQRDFRPVPLNLKFNLQVQNTMREVSSRNVIAKVEGSDPKLKDEYIVYTAHWDHLGRDPKLEGDQIYNGAVDNASGSATLLELARAFAKAKPKRTVIFLSVTAEEKGLLGSKYYAAHPLYPLERTLADINMDSMNMWGRTRDVVVVGVGQSTLEDVLAAQAAAQGRTLAPESDPEKGGYFRSDHFEFAKVGVPALDAHAGIDYIGKDAGFGKLKRDEFVEHDYHKVTDEIKPGWDLSGQVEDTQLLFQVGWAVAQGEAWPEWKTGSEFKARRDEMLKRK
jgi:Zn-dependent M28 family amino/carboxypeptidase